MGKTLFITVGTTLFDALIGATTSSHALEWMISNSFDTLIVQFGKGCQPSIPSGTEGHINIECYNFKPSLEGDMKKADLIVSHAGAGTIMEILKLGKRAAVVINNILMDDHQKELANAMGSRGHVLAIESPERLQESLTWDAIDQFNPVPYTSGDERFFPNLLDHFLGTTKQD